MPDYVRVTDRDTGTKRTVLRSELPHGNYTELKADAVEERTGLPLPPEHGAVKPLSSTTNSGPEAETKKEKSDG